MTSTIVSWGLTLCLLGAAIYVYRPDLIHGPPSPVREAKAVATNPAPSTAVKKPKAKKPTVPKVVANDTAESGSGSQGGKKRKIASAPADRKLTAETPDAKHSPQSSQKDEDILTDKDFAKQLAQAQSGTKLQVPQKQQSSKKERRIAASGAVSSPDPSGFSTEASSTTGRDADDDLTPAESPETRPNDGSISRAGDISDMLEAPAAKPTTLRLTDVSNESKLKKAANKAFEPVLSKKKRNEKQRKEEQRLAREESDRLHEAKKQEQLRKARMAAGTSNQTKANNFAATANAWQSGTSNAVKSAPETDAQPFLDTFDPVASTAGPASGSVHTEMSGANGASELKRRLGDGAAAAMTASASREGPSAVQRQEYAGEMWEQDQMKMLKEQEQEDAWESVTSKKSKRKGRQDNDSASGTSSPARPAPATTKPKINGNKVDVVPKKTETVNRFTSFQDKIDSGLQDAEWEA